MLKLRAVLNMDVGVLFRASLGLRSAGSEVRDPLVDLDVKKAIDAHTAWLARLRNIIDGTNSEVFDIPTVSAPNKCELGAWIYHENAKALHGNEEYGELYVTHKKFHALAGQVLHELYAGNKERALELLGGELKDCSSKIQLSLIRLHGQK